jgi:hypothetical protein
MVEFYAMMILTFNKPFYTVPEVYQKDVKALVVKGYIEKIDRGETTVENVPSDFKQEVEAHYNPPVVEETPEEEQVTEEGPEELPQ